jgi:hypothetical protein
LLTRFGLEVHTGIGRTGVVGVLQRGNGTRTAIPPCCWGRRSTCP